MTFEDTANSSVRTAMDQGRQAADKASQVIQDGYDAAQQYVKDRGLTWTCASSCVASRGLQSRPLSRSAMSSRRSCGASPEGRVVNNSTATFEDDVR